MVMCHQARMMKTHPCVALQMWGLALDTMTVWLQEQMTPLVTLCVRVTSPYWTAHSTGDLLVCVLVLSPG